MSNNFSEDLIHHEPYKSIFNTEFKKPNWLNIHRIFDSIYEFNSDLSDLQIIFYQHNLGCIKCVLKGVNKITGFKYCAETILTPELLNLDVSILGRHLSQILEGSVG